MDSTLFGMMLYSYRGGDIMFKKNTDEDVSETEYNTIIKPHIDKVNSFHETYYTYALILLEISVFSLLFPYSDLLHRASKSPASILETGFIYSNLCGVRIISLWYERWESNPHGNAKGV